MPAVGLNAVHGKKEHDGWFKLTRSASLETQAAWEAAFPQMKIRVLRRWEGRAQTLKRQPTKVHFHSYYHYYCLPWLLAIGSWLFLWKSLKKQTLRELLF